MEIWTKWLTIGTINNTHNLWWSNHEPLICLLNSRVQNQLSDNRKLRKITIWKLIGPETIWWKHMKCEYNENNHILVLHTLNFVVAISVKFFCFTRPFVPNLEAKSVVPELTTRDSDHWWWSLLATTFTPNLSTWRLEQNGSWLPDYIYTKS